MPRLNPRDIPPARPLPQRRPALPDVRLPDLDWNDEARARAAERAYTSGRMRAVAPPAPVEQVHRTRGVMNWLLTVVVGVGAVLLLLNRGLFLPKPGMATAGTSYNAAARAAAITTQAQNILAAMTLDEKLGQLIIPMAPDHSLSASGNDLQNMITKDHIGGFYVSDGGMNASQLRGFIQGMQGQSRIPMIISTDFEGDQGFDVLSSALPAQPSEAQVGATGDPHNAYLKGVNDGKALASVGVNVDLGPVVDVLTNVNNPILQARTFSSNTTTVTQMASNFVDGLSTTGVASCIKHYPGLGSSTGDPHQVLPVINRTLAQMQTVELAPYKSLMAAGKVDMIMDTHMLIPALDPTLPTSVSPKVINGLLRQQMGYDGVVISDALFMGGLDQFGDMAQRGLKAFEAGTDLLLGAYSEAQTRETITVLHDALTKGTITQQQIDTSVLRVLKFKEKWHIIPDTFKLTASTSAFVIPPVPAADLLGDVRRG
jgi:beta-N-acetylhexosaminidase